MTMRAVKLIAFRDEETGDLGLGIAAVVGGHPKMNAATEGLLIAHDIIEHVNGFAAIGTIDDELEALGAIWYTRGQHNDIRRDRIGSALTPAQNMAGDVIRMFMDAFNGEDCAYAQFHGARGKPIECEEDLDDVLAAASESYAGELDDTVNRTLAADEWAKFKVWARFRMRAGYRKAHARWEPRGRYAANSQFWAIVEAVEPICKRMGEGYEGYTYTLRYGNGEATCTQDESYND